MGQDNPNALKHLYNYELLAKYAQLLDSYSLHFDQERFLKIWPGLQKCEMKPRVLMIRDALIDQLPGSYKTNLKIIKKILKSGELKGFELWPLTEYVQTQGLDYPLESLKLLKEMTKIFTAEFAVRPFLKHHPELTLSYLKQCALDRDFRVRRWSSEGTRPRLPWGEKLHQFIQAPKTTIPILDLLKFDEEIFVRKSVANHLNDMTKDNPQIVISILTRWKKEAKTILEQERIEWITRHSLRTLIKNGDAHALKLVGVSTDAQVEFSLFKIKKNKIKMGESLDFSFQILSRSRNPQKLVVDYKIFFLKANGQLSEKVFKLKTFSLAANESMALSKRHAIRPITTRVYYGRTHYIEVLINGCSYGKTKWLLNL